MKEIQNEIYFSLWIFILLTLFFSGVIFVMSYHFFDAESEHVHHQESFVEPHSNMPTDIEALYSAYTIPESTIEFYYIPQSLIETTSMYSDALARFLYSDTIYKSIQHLWIHMYEQADNVRWNMRHATLRFFGVHNMSVWEFLSVGIHEFAHYFDIYILEKSLFQDVSRYFYDISWESTKVIVSGQKSTDFVSGYAMTNKYEDFAETYTYFVLHNDDFFLKAQQSEILQKKYDFFGKFIFKKHTFQNTDFSIDNRVKSYYWDITKIDINHKKLLQYLEK